ncbi:MAG: CDP-alcohol phosphatidyltransferase family protein [Bacteroidota bacterium]
MKKYIPNLFTLLNLFSGCIAVLFATQSNFVAAAFFVFLGIFFDFFDGLLARKLNVQSELGIQLDSLADMVTSGLVPGIVMYKLLSKSLNVSEQKIDADWNSGFDFIGFELPVLPLVGLFITLASCYRLAKFNLDEDQQTYFKGLPTPANALLILSLPLILQYPENEFVEQLISNIWFLLGLTSFSCYILNSDIKLFALKFKGFGFKENKLKYSFILICIVLLFLLNFLSIPIIVFLYIIISIFDSYVFNEQSNA